MSDPSPYHVNGVECSKLAYYGIPHITVVIKDPVRGIEYREYARQNINELKDRHPVTEEELSAMFDSAKEDAFEKLRNITFAEELEKK